MRSNAKFLIQRELRAVDVWRIGQVQTAVGRKLQFGNLLERFADRIDTPDLIAHVHSRPFLV
jgi:hypothetical protein